MIEHKLTFGDIVEYKDGFYTFERRVLSKHVESGTWYDAIVYQDVENSAFYVREKKDFEMKFTLVLEPL